MYILVEGPRCVGYANSDRYEHAAAKLIEAPKARINRPAIKALRFLQVAEIIAPRMITMALIMTANRRPIS